MASSRIRASDKGAPQKPAPLIPEYRKYIYKPALMTTAAQEITKSARTKKVKINVPTTPYATTKLVHALCSAAKANVWDAECEKILAERLPLREHHKAFLSHNMFVTMIGAVVARALEQGTRGCEDAPDLLANRHFVRSIACHDSSKTSTIEAAAYSGIMAVHLEKEALVSNAKKPHGQKDASCSLNKLYTDIEALTTAMANFGFKHHYENNPHHPEHFHEGEMGDMNLVEAIVDGLACIFERNKTHTDVHSWLSLYYIDRFKGRNKASARKIMEALKLHITGADYKALEDFRRRTMDASELEQALVPQLRLHSTNETGKTHPNPQKANGDLFATDYQTCRLEAVAWLAELVPPHREFNRKGHPVFMPAVNVMDRYITVCVDSGEDPRQLLKDIGNIRLACLSLSLKMNAVNTEINLSALAERNGSQASVQGVEEAESRILTKLHGALFPDNAKNMISILCKYLILKHISRSVSRSPLSDLDRGVAHKAAEVHTKIALDLKLLRFQRWKCIAVCCLLGAIDVCTNDPSEMIYGKIMEKLKPGEFTREELHDLKGLLTVGCVVCSSSFHRRVRRYLLDVSSMSCTECRIAVPME
ncbi:hypothetical protein D9C73_010108 [Collichthys lucidus]|uniref:Uncharacterized protein n=1 Tax=Collichthys lucidus TaxID=240159 RepID=A0A4U5UMY2_COLLU|nr:hypothetical protein D9C73_010108 [Collichthys lucidus]